MNKRLVFVQTEIEGKISIQIDPSFSDVKPEPHQRIIDHISILTLKGYLNPVYAEWIINDIKKGGNI